MELPPAYVNGMHTPTCNAIFRTPNKRGYFDFPRKILIVSFAKDENVDNPPHTPVINIKLQYSLSLLWYLKYDVNIPTTKEAT